MWPEIMETIRIPEDWTATAENISALPRPLRRYIHDLQRSVDFIWLMRENAHLRRENAALRKKCEALAAKVRDRVGARQNP
jgi:hypothetical protein